MGVVVPNVSTLAQTRIIVSAARYKVGDNGGSLGTCPGTRATWHQTGNWSEFVRWSNENIMVWALIESAAGIGNIDEILSVPMLDAIMMGLQKHVIQKALKGKDMSKQFVRLILTAVMVSCMWISPAHAQSYPKKPVRVIVVYPAGAVADVMVRIVGERLNALLGQPFIFDNRPGGSGIAGTQVASRASPDGYTLLMTGVNHVTNTGLFAKLPYDSVRDFTPVGVIGIVPVVLVAHPSTGFKTVQDLIKTAKARPGAINFASSGTGTAGHMATEMFARAAGIKMTHVPYRGGPQALTDTVGGQVQVNSLALSLAMPFIKDGRLIPMLQAGMHKDKALPNVPTMDEIGMRNFVIEVWFGLLAPANLEPEPKRVLRTTLTGIMREPAVIARLDAQNILAASGDPIEMGQMLKSQMQTLPAFLHDLGIKPE